MRPSIQYLRRIEGLALRRSIHAKRNVHTSKIQHASVASLPPAAASPSHMVSRPSSIPQAGALDRVPTSSVLRSYLITSISSSPPLLSACFAILRRMLDSRSTLMNIDKNRLLNWLLKTTFYAQFCAGETQKEVQQNTTAAKTNLGYDGIILEFALEVLEGEGGEATADSEATERAIEIWRKGMLETVQMASPGDFIGLKWSGLGPYALRLLKEQRDPTPSMERAILEACDAAAAKKVALLPGAEKEVTNAGIDQWTLKLQKRYNTAGPGRVIMYSTYQAYLKSTPAKLARHLALAQKDGYTLGVKLVRGAYLASEPRHLIWSTKEETDKYYDALAESLLKCKYSEVVQPVHDSEAFPHIDVVLATHNHESVRKAQAIRNEQASRGEEHVRLAYAQLQGMADEISCELVQAGEAQDAGNTDAPRVFKCMTWGTTTECLNYLLRRAAENRDAASRTEDTRKAMGKELWRRAKTVVGLA